MRAARLHRVGEARAGDEPVPGPGPGATLVEVTAAGLCGSGLHWLGQRRQGLTIAMARRMNERYEPAIGMVARAQADTGSLVTGPFGLQDAAAASGAAAEQAGLTVLAGAMGGTTR